MNRHPRIMVAVLVTLGLTGALAEVKVGSTLPAVQAGWFDGAWPDTRGQVVLIDFWASWCGPCKESMPELDKLAKRFKAQGLVVVGVCVDEKADDMKRFVSANPVSFPLVRDREAKLVGAVSPATMPTSLLIDRKGRVRMIEKGFHGAESVDRLTRAIEDLLKEPVTP